MLTRRALLAAAPCLFASLAWRGGGASAAPVSDAEGRYALGFSGSHRETIVGGQLAGRVNVQSLAGLNRCCAMGPSEGLRGEITICDGALSIARIRRGTIVAERTFEATAPFLVWAEVRAWTTVAVPEAVVTMSDVEAFLPDAAGRAGLDPSLAFPFIIKSTVERLAFHVLHKTDDAPHDMAAHQRIKAAFLLEREWAELVGFHSTRHHGVFTHPGVNTHVHVLARGGAWSGHVDDVHLGRDSVLWLPA